MIPQTSNLVTVVIPLYNKGALVRRAVESVLAQTHDDLELIVVDDGSTDRGIDALDPVRDPRLRLITQSNRGPGAARNLGWRRGRGPLVAFLDADDLWKPDFLEWSVGQLNRDADLAASVSGYCELHGPDDVRSAEEIDQGLPAGRFDAAAADARTFKVVLTYMLPVTTVVRRDVLMRYGGFFERDRCTYGEDNFLWTQVLLNHPVYCGLDPRVIVDRTGSSLSVLGTLGSRSVEPLLTHPDEIRAVCPAPLRPVLDQLMAERALKRACTLAAVGKWREARALRRNFRVPGSLRLPYGVASALVTNPVGAWLARTALWGLRLAKPR
jgi:hypothetical protein